MEINSVIVHRERETEKIQVNGGKIKQAVKGERQRERERERGYLKTVSHYWAYCL
jgi:hypothetical protein